MRIKTDYVRLAVLHGHRSAQQLISTAEAEGVALLPTGAKLYLGADKSLFADGYSHDGKDAKPYNILNSHVADQRNS